MSAYMEAIKARQYYDAGLIDAAELAFWEAGARYEAARDAYYYDFEEEEEDGEEDS